MITATELFLVLVLTSAAALVEGVQVLRKKSRVGSAIAITVFVLVVTILFSIVADA